MSAFLVAVVGVKREHVQIPRCRSSSLQEGSRFPMCSCLLAIQSVRGRNLWQKMCPVVWLLFPGISVGLSYHTQKQRAVFGDYSRNSTGKLN